MLFVYCHYWKIYLCIYLPLLLSKIPSTKGVCLDIPKLKVSINSIKCLTQYPRLKGVHQLSKMSFQIHLTKSVNQLSKMFVQIPPTKSINQHSQKSDQIPSTNGVYPNTPKFKVSINFIRYMTKYPQLRGVDQLSKFPSKYP